MIPDKPGVRPGQPQSENMGAMEVEADRAWHAYRATQLAMCADPSLLENPYFTALQDTAFARFLLRIEAI